MSTVSVFPHRKTGATVISKAVRAAVTPKKRHATRGNILPATSVLTTGMVVRGATKTNVREWPNASQNIYSPNAIFRSSVFGCTRTVKAQPTAKAAVRPRMKVVGTIVEFEVNDGTQSASTSQYEILYRGEILNQLDSEVWQMALLTARRAGWAGEEIAFSLNEWCRALGRPDNTAGAHQAILDSLERLKGATLKIYNRNTRRRDWISMIVTMGQCDGRYTVTIDPRIVGMIDNDSTEIDVIRKGSVKTLLGKWCHDFFSTTSQTFTWKLATLRELSGSTHMEPRKFKAALQVAIEELKDCKTKDGTALPPLFADETKIETQVRDGQACEVLTVVKATNSRLVQPRAAAEVVEEVAPAKQVVHAAPVAEPIRNASAPRQANRKVTTAADDFVPVWDRNIDPSDERSSEERKYAWLRERDQAESPRYAAARN